jgi:CDGSH-type Zn-finger protein
MVSGIALCRCGASNNKPFCDGTHATIGFSSENKIPADDNNGAEYKVRDIRKSYVGKEITIHDNRRTCSHASECVNNLSSVFNLNSRPWINPDLARADEIIDTIRKCPSGALSYSINGIEYREPNENGPYLITGGIDLIGESIRWGDGASREHYTLCRCGASKNKPFCDGTHKTINFRDDKN